MLFCGVPGSLEEDWVKPIGAWTFMGLDMEECSMNISSNDRGVQVSPGKEE